jgi:hypothetical protein
MIFADSIGNSSLSSGKDNKKGRNSGGQDAQRLLFNYL